MSRDHEPATPESAESALQAVRDAMDAAREDLKKCRDDEIGAQAAYKRELRRLLLSAECPKVGVTDGMRTTVAERDAWVEQRAAALELDWQVSVAARRAAADHLSTLRAQASVAQSIAGSVRA